eukprot:CAMPEP_0205827670 /NCGR_PEP_ID=MMETSP0206-20130828/32778_1 /ASSEMBLY_ACC=CAM_ASM_000279 /TAXON_ID=36767 /ORGANISM="Euplotes focardii, Strain TN1" /LENGTH=214 /DNA_ID=CAMNT_0053128797 /DNA_START=42 /DNA_END=686 /DNA_ORIENTATION=-
MNGSQPFRSVQWALKMKGVAYEEQFVMPGSKKASGSRNPAYLAMVSTGQIPAIKDGDFVLSQSPAILLYLAEKHGWEDLYPTDIRTRALIQQYMHWHHHNTRMVSAGLFAPVVLKFPAPPGAKRAIKFALNTIERTYLGDRAYLCADTPTLADLLAYEELVQCLPKYCDLLDFGLYPNISAWMERMAKLPAHEEVHDKILKKLGSLFKKPQAKL